ncbi:MAG: ankyrin repeat domain-containing protein [Variovorax sp.]|nr:MAG: ankyrin repeat domain-containing protein [Variovorax sp.]
MAKKTIFEAARAGDTAAVQAFLAAGADVAALDAHGFTALQSAAMGANSAPEADILAVMQWLVEAGSPLEFKGADGRTALYLAAEFAHTAAPVQLLIDAGANADISDAHGNHVIVNAMMEEVQELISRVTGRPMPEEDEPEPEPEKMSAPQWRAARLKIDAAFAALTGAGLVALHDAGTTQSDGFSDCSEVFQERGGEKAGLHGFCFYTRQDLNRAKRTSQLSLAFWGAPQGGAADMLRVGRLITGAIEAVGLPMRWNESAATRIEVDLRAR